MATSLKDLGIIAAVMKESLGGKVEPNQVKVVIKLSKNDAKSLAYDITAGRGSPLYQDQIKEMSERSGFEFDVNNVKIIIEVK